jgi:hypothetical protein
MTLIDQIRYEGVKYNNLTDEYQKNKILIAIYKLASMEEEIVQSKAIINIKASGDVFVFGLYLEKHDKLDDQIKELLNA